MMKLVSAALLLFVSFIAHADEMRMEYCLEQFKLLDEYHVDFFDPDERDLFEHACQNGSLEWLGHPDDIEFVRYNVPSLPVFNEGGSEYTGPDQKIWECVNRRMEEDGLDEFSTSNLQFRLYEEECQTTLEGGSQVSEPPPIHQQNPLFELKEPTIQQSSPNFRVEAKETWHEIFGSWVNGLHFQALDDRIIITNIIINRGNCGFNTDRLPLTLGFGNTARIGIHCPVSNVIEVQIEANTGSWVFNFQ